MCPHKPDTLPTPWCVYIQTSPFPPSVPIIVLKHFFYWFRWRVKNGSRKEREFVQRPANCIVSLMRVKTTISWRKSFFRTILCVKNWIKSNTTWRKTRKSDPLALRRRSKATEKKEVDPVVAKREAKDTRQRKVSWSCLTRSAAIETLFKETFVWFYLVLLFRPYPFFSFLFYCETRSVNQSFSRIFL